MWRSTSGIFVCDYPILSVSERRDRKGVTEMSKAVKKKARRLRRTIRRTLGTLFLISALVVAAIPVDNLQASNVDGGIAPQSRPAGKKVTIDVEGNGDASAGVYNTHIPIVADNEQIYTDESGNFQFAYVQSPTSGIQKIAVILGYNKSATLQGDNHDTLIIPEQVAAYMQYTDTQGTSGGYVAANKKGEPLFYAVKTMVEIKDPVTGEVTGTEEDITKRIYRPCYREDKEWEGTLPEDFYYYDSATKQYVQTTSTEYQRIVGVDVRYIGNQYLKTGKDSSGKYTTWAVDSEISDSDPTKGIFAQVGMIKYVEGASLEGIGTYAFYNCTNLEKITIGGRLNEIGNYAFNNCSNMTEITGIGDSSISQIGDHAFYNCRSLLEIVIPTQIVAIGDSAFEDCYAISKIDLCSNERENNLAKMGWDVFKNCKSLQSITFPSTYSETVDISAFEGCQVLQSVTARNNNLTFSEDMGNYSFEAFKKMLEQPPVSGSFYFEGTDASELHEFAKKNCFAFSYIDYRDGVYYKLDEYEITIEDENTKGRTTFRVDKNFRLLSCVFDGTVETLDIPNKIGPSGIHIIGSGLFRNNCTLKKVIIPEMVQSIESDAFRGCHNLANVIFASGNTQIGANAFRTQDNTGHSCTEGKVLKVKDIPGNDPNDESPLVKLYFTGPISSTSGPFTYAMSEDGRYENEEQQKSYITYYSGWPQNLEVRYNPDTKMSELVDFPALSDLNSNKYVYDSKPDSKYAYLTQENASAAASAYNKYVSSQPMTVGETAIINAALNVVIPEGVESVQEGLFKAKENLDNGLTFNRTVTAYSLKTIKSGKENVDSNGTVTIEEGTGTFAGCEHLSGVNLSSVRHEDGTITGTQTIEKHAFQGCSALVDVAIPETVETLGIRPFAGCEKLSNVNFQNNPKYVCENSIIYELENGSKYKVIECLEGRDSKYIQASEMAGIKELEEEAFMGTALRQVDLTASTIKMVPDRAFAETERMQNIALPITCDELGDYVFERSGVTFVSIPTEEAFYVTENSFSNMAEAKEDVVIGCVPGSRVEQYADRNGFGKGDPTLGERTYIVIFRDYVKDAGAVLEVDRQEIIGGKYVTPPTPNGRDGQVFLGWQDEEGNLYTAPFEVSEDLICTALYDVAGPDYGKLTVTFQNENGETIKSVYVVSGEDVDPNEIPNAPAKEGYTFTGWDRDLTNVTESFSTRPLYRAVAGDECVVRYFVDGKLYYETTVKTGSNAPNITVEGKTGITWVPSLNNILKDTDLTAVYGNEPDNPNPSPSPSPSPGPNPSPSPSPGPNGNGGNTGSSNTGSSNTVKHTLTVQGGSGSGSYAPGEQIIITANPPARGQEFSSWTVSPANTVVTDRTMSSVIITMPNNDVAAIANYRARTTTSTGTGNGSNTNSNRPSSGTGTANKGNTVVIDKNGLSNTGVVSATVNGSSDNFTIKVSESSTATEAVLRALLAEYGSVDNIKYFPMDISLYDSTGTKLITDTTGLSVSITLPLPDSLITYAGNNKVAGVVNDKLDKLTPRFTTINGVACVTFTAEHFSPYVIYVDITNLSDGTISDSTPTTGDGIHPKWFLSIGLACLSFVMFMVKDNGKSPKKKQKVAVRA